MTLHYRGVDFSHIPDARVRAALSDMDKQLRSAFGVLYNAVVTPNGGSKVVAPVVLPFRVEAPTTQSAMGRPGELVAVKAAPEETSRIFVKKGATASDTDWDEVTGFPIDIHAVLLAIAATGLEVYLQSATPALSETVPQLWWDTSSLPWKKKSNLKGAGGVMEWIEDSSGLE